MMTEEQRRFEQWAAGIYDTRLLKDEKGNYRGQVLQQLWQEWQAALTQPASPALKLPDEMTPKKASRCYGGQVVGYLDGWNACIAEVKRLNAPHTAPIEPICATGGAEWVSNERVEEIIYRAEMFGHGAGYLPEEVIPMAKELLALRKAFSEPYGYVHQGVYEAGFSSGLSADHEAYKNSSTHIPLYRKP